MYSTPQKIIKNPNYSYNNNLIESIYMHLQDKDGQGASKEQIAEIINNVGKKLLPHPESNNNQTKNPDVIVIEDTPKIEGRMGTKQVIGLKRIGVSEDKLTIEFLTDIELKFLSTKKAIFLINSIQSSKQDINYKFDIVLEIFRHDPTFFEEICDDPLSVAGGKIADLFYSDSAIYCAASDEADDLNGLSEPGNYFN